jgi:hypothetical protein
VFYHAWLMHLKLLKCSIICKDYSMSESDAIQKISYSKYSQLSCKSDRTPVFRKTKDFADFFFF